MRKIPLTEAPKLLGIALQDEHRRSELVRQQAELKAEREAQAATIKVGQEFANFARGNPAGARALDLVYNAIANGELTPEQAIQRFQGGGTAPETNGVPAPTSAAALDPRLGAEIASVREELTGVKSALAARTAADEARELKGKIDSALSADPFLRARPEAHEAARTLLKPHLDSGLSVQDATALVATTLKGIATQTVTAERDRLAALANLGSPPPSAGVPPVTMPDTSKMPPNLAPQDRRRWMSDQARKAGQELAAAVRRGIVSGPSQ